VPIKLLSEATSAFTIAYSWYGAAICAIGQSNQLKWLHTQSAGSSLGGGAPWKRWVRPIAAE